MISLAILLSGYQKVPPTGIPLGADAKKIGKVRPATFTAIRDYHTLRRIDSLTPAKQATFTGTVITLDFPQKGNVHVMNFRNGNRVVLQRPDSQTTENGVPLTRMLTTLPPKIDIRIAATNEAGFEVKLPGEEKKLTGFTGTLMAYNINRVAHGLTMSLRNGKVVSSSWIKPPSIHK